MPGTAPALAAPHASVVDAAAPRLASTRRADQTCRAHTQSATVSDAQDVIRNCTYPRLDMVYTTFTPAEGCSPASGLGR